MVKRGFGLLHNDSDKGMGGGKKKKSISPFFFNAFFFFFQGPRRRQMWKLGVLSSAPPREIMNNVLIVLKEVEMKV